MKCNTASQFRPFCDSCERDNMSDWIEERQRYECDACQRDHASDEPEGDDYADRAEWSARL